VEHGAHIMYLTEQLGGGRPLSEAQVRELVILKQKAGISTKTDCLTSDHTTICDSKAPVSEVGDWADAIAEAVIRRINRS